MGTSTEVTPKLCAHERAEVKRFVNDARLWHPWLRINRALRVMLQTRWSAEAWLIVRVEHAEEPYAVGRCGVNESPRGGRTGPSSEEDEAGPISRRGRCRPPMLSYRAG